MSLSLSSHTAKGEDVVPLLPPSPLSTSGVPGILGGATSPDKTPLPGLGGTVGPPLLSSSEATCFNAEFCAEVASCCDPSGGNRDISSAKLDTGLECPAPTSRPTTPALNVGFFEGLRACAALPTGASRIWARDFPRGARRASPRGVSTSLSYSLSATWSLSTTPSHKWRHTPVPSLLDRTARAISCAGSWLSHC